ncbi:glycosyltransferase [Glaciecola sp. 1036]|uniref:glycosyltransferase n=1 Tax=Alteromonadaceae TaxID=72275 RepID=UPI003CFC9E94
MATQISFIIPHMGREELLDQTIASITSLDFDLTAIEVIVVTKNQEISSNLKAFEKTLSIQFLHSKSDKTISYQRNMGAQAASGEIFCFLDADIGLSPDWLKVMLNELDKDKNRKIVSASQKASEKPSPLELLRVKLSNAVLDQNVEFLPGRNLVMLKETFYEVEGFPEHLITCEDYYFTQKVAELGTLYYSSATWYVHLGEDKEFIPMAKKEVWRGLSNFKSIKGRRIPFSEWPSFIAPLIITFGLLGAIPFYFADLGIIANTFVFSALVVFLSYCVRLRRLTGGKPGFLTILTFYSLYFPARTWGTIKGILN